MKVLDLDRAELERHPLPPVREGDKDSHGKILIVAGGRETPGAALLAAHAAMRSGAGKLQIATPAEIAIPLAMAMPEAMVTGFASASDGGFTDEAVDAIAERAAKADAIVAGPGVVPNRAAEHLAQTLRGLNRPLALDAGLLQTLPDPDQAARNDHKPTVLLPHSGELAALLSCNEEEIEADRLAAGRRCADRYAATVLVKGSNSLMVDPDGSAWRYCGGSAGLGVSGSGDVLAGIVGGLMARGASGLTSLLWGVWLHGEAGAALERSIGCPGFLAREIPTEIPGLLRL